MGVRQDWVTVVWKRAQGCPQGVELSPLFHGLRNLVGGASPIRRHVSLRPYPLPMVRSCPTQTVGYVATPSDWMTEFERKVKPDARPLMMLRPFGPVMFVFDIDDTEGKPAPADLMRPFDR